MDFCSHTQKDGKLISRSFIIRIFHLIPNLHFLALTHHPYDSSKALVLCEKHPP